MLKKLFKESLVYGLSRYIGKFIGIFLLPLYTAVLQPSDYGILDLLGTITIVSTFLIISGTDTALGYFYYRKEYAYEKKEMVSSSLWLRIFFSLTVFIIIALLSKNISLLIFGRDYSLFIIITGLTIVFSSIYSFLFDLLRFEVRPWMYSIISTAVILIQILLNIYFVLILSEGVKGVLIANVIGYFIFFIITIVYVFKKYGMKLSKKWIKRIFNYGFPLIGTGIAVWVLSSTDRYFLAHYTDLSSVGIYAVGMKLASFLGLIAGALQLAWGPFAANIQYEPEAKIVYRKVFVLFFIINIMAVFGISMFSIDILKVFTQPAYYSAKVVVPFLCIATVLSSAYFIVAIGIGLTKKAQHTVWITLIGASINLLLNYLLTPVYGVIGASFALMCSYFVIFILTLLMSQKHYPIPYNYSKVIFLFIPAAVIIGLSYYFNLKLFIRIPVSFLYLSFSFIYLYLSYKNSPELKKVIAKIRKIKNYRFKQPENPNLDL
jgi:O-antigen/teichoic acid export membrane protein